MPNSTDNWISLKEAGAILQCCARTVRRLAERRQPLTGKPCLTIRFLTPRHAQVLESSVRSFRAAIESDAEFWLATEVSKDAPEFGPIKGGRLAMLGKAARRTRKTGAKRH